MTEKLGNLLIVDDNQGIIESLTFSLKHEFQNIHSLNSPEKICETLENFAADIILLDMNFSTGINKGEEGLFWLNKIKEIDPAAAVILITAYGDVELAVKGIKNGAADFILKPWDTNKLVATLKSAYKLKKSEERITNLENRQIHLSEEFDKQHIFFAGNSPVMQKMLDTIKKVAKTDANILLFGENGTGKELVAREIHKLSNRSREALITIDMGSLSESLFESELFGHVKGAFTDAKDDRAGRFETASGGSLFLDEIGNLSISMQSKLLTALQNRIIYRVGSSKPINIDIRLISATNKNLFELIKLNQFREDLLYRLNTIYIEIPPLRERGEDVILLAQYFFDKFKKKYSKFDLTLSPKALIAIRNCSWPGNVRELEHTIEKGVILSDKNQIYPEDLFLMKSSEKQEDTFNLEELEKNTIKKAIDKHRGNMSATAKELGITRSTLYSKIEKYGL